MRTIILNKRGYILSIGFILSALMLASVFFELRQSRFDLIEIHQYEGLALLDIIKRSAINSIASQSEIQDQLTERLFNNARLLAEIERHQPLTDSMLQDFAVRNNLYRINVFDETGIKIASNVFEPHNGKSKYQPKTFFQPILDGKLDEIDIGLKEARNIEGQRFAVAVKRRGGGVVVINVDAAEKLAFDNRVGVQKLIEDISSQQELVYVALQNEAGLLAASPVVQGLSSLADDGFLQTNEVQARTTRFNDQDILELVSPFEVDGQYKGRLRIGLHLGEVRELEKRMLNRAIITSIGVIFIGFILINVIINSHNYRFLQQQHARIQTYTGNILQAMSDAVIGVDARRSIRFVNNAARRILDMGQSEVTGRPIDDFIDDGQAILEALGNNQTLENVEQSLRIKSLKRPLSVAVSLSFVFDEAGKMDTGVILLRDQTRRKQLEEELRRKEKLTAMGQLASGVAHEIRNPLNAISMIVQRFQKEFEPTTDREEYFGLTRIVRSEIERIGQIIRQFLDLARPPKLNLTAVSVAEMISQSVEVVKAQADAKKIQLTAVTDVQAVIQVDKNQFHQALLNLLQNAMDAVATGGTVSIQARQADQHIYIEVADDGAGIPPEQQKRIFDLYFTTKPTGTGLGLAQVHRIVTQHRGEVSVQSQPGHGTTFTLAIPTEGEA